MMTDKPQKTGLLCDKCGFMLFAIDDGIYCLECKKKIEPKCVKYKGKYRELLTGRDIPRNKRFYRKDKDGYYYIPEIENE